MIAAEWIDYDLTSESFLALDIASLDLCEEDRRTLESFGEPHPEDGLTLADDTSCVSVHFEVCHPCSVVLDDACEAVEAW